MTPELQARLDALDAAIGVAGGEARSLRAALSDPPPAPTYTLTARTAAVDEGSTAVFELRTTHVAPGSAIAYHLVGAAATPQDIEAAELGVFVLDADGFALLEVPIRADAATEGDETLECRLEGPDSTVLASAAIVVKDTSQTPPVAAPKLKAETFDRSALLCFAKWFGDTNFGSYNRYDQPEVVTSIAQWGNPYVDVINIDMQRGVERPWLSAQYTLLVEGVPHATFTPPASGHRVRVPLRLAELAVGWRRLDITGLGPGESTLPWYAFVYKGGLIPAEALAVMPVITHAFTVLRSGTSIVHHGLVPAGFTPMPKPLALPPLTPLVPPLKRSAMQYVQIAAGDPDMDRYTPKQHPLGFWHCIDVQSYGVEQLMVQGDQRHDAMDGPRGVGSITMATHIMPGATGIAGDPEGRRRKRWYVLEPGRLCRVDADGTVTTLAGHYRTTPGEPMRHRGTYHPSVPAARRNLWEAWGAAKDPRSLAVQVDAEPIPSEGNLRPHTGAGVLFLVANTRHGVINGIRFSPTQHAVEPTITEVAVIGSEVWDVVAPDDEPGVMYCSERANHRITRRSIDSGEVLGVMLEGRALSYVGADRKVYYLPGVTTAQVQAEPVNGPEGLFVHGPWLYVASWAMRQIIRVHRFTGLREVVRELKGDGNSHFGKIIVMPDGTVLDQTWSSLTHGVPGGVDVVDTVGPGLPWLTFGYGCGLGYDPDGLLLWSTSSRGFWGAFIAQPGQETVSRGDFDVMTAEWRARGGPLDHGNFGYGMRGLALPWGESPRIERFLRNAGHSVGAA